MADKAYRTKHDVYDEMERADLLPDARLLYLFLLNNPRLSLTGLYRMEPREMVFYTGIGPERVRMCIQNLTAAGLVVYDEGLLWIPRIPRDNTFMRLTYWRKLLMRDEQEYAAHPSAIPRAVNASYKSWRAAYEEELAIIREEDGVDAEQQEAKAKTDIGGGRPLTAADVVPPWERGADRSDDNPPSGIPSPSLPPPEQGVPTPEQQGTPYPTGTTHTPAPSDNGGDTHLPTYLYQSLSLSLPGEDCPIEESRGCGGPGSDKVPKMTDRHAIAADMVPPGSHDRPVPVSVPAAQGRPPTQAAWRAAVDLALRAQAAPEGLRRWISDELLRYVIAPVSWPASGTSEDALAVPDVVVPFQSADGNNDWAPDGNELPDPLTTVTFVRQWARYLRWRWLTWAEWPDGPSQHAQWHQLARWHDPIACIEQSISSSFKGVFPLRADIEHGRYQRSGTILRSSRAARRRTQRGGCVTDTVIGYTACIPPDTSDRSP